jgi:uncharacterized LabA/DUF88 family protein
MQPLPKPERNGQHSKVSEYRPLSDSKRFKVLADPPTPPMPQSSAGLTSSSFEDLMDDFDLEMTRLDRGRVIVFIDGANLFYAALNLGIEIDYTKLLARLTQNGRFIRAYFYTGVDPANEKQQGFLLWMRRNGYRVITKDLIQFPDGSKKASLEVMIAVDMLQLSQHCDTIVLLSGDGDLTYAVESVTYRGTRVEVFGLRSMSSDSLINVADTFTDLEGIKRDVQKGA